MAANATNVDAPYRRHIRQIRDGNSGRDSWRLANDRIGLHEVPVGAGGLRSTV